MSFFIVLTSGPEFTGRLTSTFTTPHRLRGDWEVSLTSCNLDSKCFVLCDVVGYSYIDSQLYQFLEYYDGYKSMKYVKVERKVFDSINIYIKQNMADDSYNSTSKIVCVLHFRKA
jgi:hypothetical protein